MVMVTMTMHRMLMVTGFQTAEMKIILVQSLKKVIMEQKDLLILMVMV